MNGRSALGHMGQSLADTPERVDSGFVWGGSAMAPRRCRRMRSAPWIGLRWGVRATGKTYAVPWSPSMRRRGSRRLGHRSPGKPGRMADIAGEAVGHFKWEETLMEESAFPEAAAHKQGHHALVVQVGDMAKHGDMSVPQDDLMAMFTHRLVDRIITTDKVLADFLHERRDVVDA